MSEKDHSHEQIERLLKQARPAGPSESLKARVTEAARAAWEQAPAEVPWQIPVWRLLVSAAAAAIIIALGNQFGDFARPGAMSGPIAAADVSNPELEELVETVYGPSRIRLVARRRRLDIPETTLRARAESIEQMLDEMDNKGAQGQSTPSGGRSWLLRCRPHLGSYS